MENINIEEVILSIFGSNAKPVSGKEIVEHEPYDKRVSALVFLPSGNGYIISDDEESTQSGGKK